MERDAKTPELETLDEYDSSRGVRGRYFQHHLDRHAIERGKSLVEEISALDIDGLLDTVTQIARHQNKGDFFDTAADLGIDTDALLLLDNADPPIDYAYYFCTPECLQEYPKLAMYYRNVAMLSGEVMGDLGLDTHAYELSEAVPSAEAARELAQYFNRIVSELVKTGGVTPHQHLAMMLFNIGDSL